MMLAGFVSAASAQSPRCAPDEKNCSRNATAVRSIRIEDGKVWVNGNRLTADHLPPGLRKLSSDYAFQATMVGEGDFMITLFGEAYVVRDKSVEVAPIQQVQSNTTAGFQPGTASAKTEYYARMRDEQPNLFYNLNREAQLYEECMQLVLDYRMARGDVRKHIRAELRERLDQLFEINMINMERQIESLEGELKAAREGLEARRLHKDEIIRLRMQELTGDSEK